MPSDQMLRDAQLPPHVADLVLEQPLQGLAELQLHAFRKATHVVVALYYLAGDVAALDAVGIYGALGQPLDVVQPG